MKEGLHAQLQNSIEVDGGGLASARIMSLPSVKFGRVLIPCCSPDMHPLDLMSRCGHFLDEAVNQNASVGVFAVRRGIILSCLRFRTPKLLTQRVGTLHDAGFRL